jgi:hypothetical protein
MNTTEKIMTQLEDNQYEYAVAVATQSEIDASAACGMLAMVVDNQEIV